MAPVAPWLRHWGEGGRGGTARLDRVGRTEEGAVAYNALENSTGHRQDTVSRASKSPDLAGDLPLASFFSGYA